MKVHYGICTNGSITRVAPALNHKISNYSNSIVPKRISCQHVSNQDMIWVKLTHISPLHFTFPSNNEFDVVK